MMNIIAEAMNLGVNASDFPAIDVDKYGNFVAFDGKNSVNSNGTTLFLSEKIKIKFPLVQMLDNGSFLLVDMRSVSNNAFIFNADGVLENAFFVGDAVEDLAFIDEKLIVSYFDEGVFGNPPSTEGLAIFDRAGNVLFGVNSSLVEEYICDCYALCKSGENAVYFFAYTEFELVKLSLKNFKMERIKVPEILSGASAMVFNKDTVLFFNPYEYKNSLFRYHLYSKQTEKLGKVDFSILKGLENGQFLAIKDDFYYVIRFE